MAAEMAEVRAEVSSLRAQLACRKSAQHELNAKHERSLRKLNRRAETAERRARDHAASVAAAAAAACNPRRFGPCARACHG
jgi:predicted  nucleic acid-binding Zn-ribbon protein